MKALLQYLFVGLAGFAGAIARVAMARLFGRFVGFPVGTMVINVSGTFFLGWFGAIATERYPLSDTMRLAIGAGFVGAYTTFSTFMYESNKLADDGAGIKATMNLVGSLVLGLFAVRLGIMIARRM